MEPLIRDRFKKPFIDGEIIKFKNEIDQETVILKKYITRIKCNYHECWIYGKNINCIVPRIKNPELHHVLSNFVKQ